MVSKMKKNVTRFLFVLIMCFTFFKVFSQDSVIFFDFYDFENCNQWQYSNILKITKNKYGNRNVRQDNSSLKFKIISVVQEEYLCIHYFTQDDKFISTFIISQNDYSFNILFNYIKKYKKLNEVLYQLNSSEKVICRIMRLEPGKNTIRIEPKQEYIDYILENN
jgi:hypothetical protein